jgi:hypothetical protein
MINYTERISKEKMEEEIKIIIERKKEILKNYLLIETNKENIKFRLGFSNKPYLVVELDDELEIFKEIPFSLLDKELYIIDNEIRSKILNIEEVLIILEILKRVNIDYNKERIISEKFKPLLEKIIKLDEKINIKNFIVLYRNGYYPELSKDIIIDLVENTAEILTEIFRVIIEFEDEEVIDIEKIKEIFKEFEISKIE